jgi:hypothetical protein
MKNTFARIAAPIDARSSPSHMALPIPAAMAMGALAARIARLTMRLQSHTTPAMQRWRGHDARRTQ